MGERKLVVGYESALEFWRGVRAAAGLRDEGDPEGRVFGERRLSVSEMAELAARACGTDVPIHVQVSGAGARHHNELIVDHVWAGPEGGKAPFSLGNGLSVARMPVVFVQLAQELDEISLAQVACEMCGTYGLAPWAERGMVNDVRPLVGLSELDAYAHDALALGVRGASRACDALRLVAPMSNSPRETDSSILLALGRPRGGLGFGGFELNKTIRLSGKAAEAVGTATIKPDFSWGDRIVTEYDSEAEHRSPEQLARDERKRLAYRSVGMDCLTLTNGILSSDAALNLFADDLERSLGLRRRPANQHMLERRAELRARLFGPERASAALERLR